MLEPHRAGIEPRQVEKVGCELRQPLHLLGHRLEKLAPGGLVEILVAKELEKAPEREDRRAELMRGIGDELAAGARAARGAPSEPHRHHDRAPLALPRPLPPPAAAKYPDGNP